MTLAIRYRPHKFGDVAGQRSTVAILNRMAKRKAVPSAMLFYGSRGCGKTTSARILGAALNCAEPPGPASSWPCGTCPSCLAVAAGSSTDVIEVDAASNGSVAEIRRLCELAQYSTAGEWRVFLLDEAHSMSREAGDTLLKEIEEPRDRTLWVLLTTEAGRILPTVSSRCMPFMFSRLAPEDITAQLARICQAEGIGAEPALLTSLAHRADGAMRDAVMLLDQCATVGITTLARWQELVGEEDFAPALVRAAADGDHPALFAALDQIVTRTGDFATITSRVVSCLRDILVLGAGGTVTAQGEGLVQRRELARRLDAARVVQAMQVVWDLQVRIRTEDRRSGLELAAVMVSEKLHKPPAGTTANGNGHAKRPTAEDIRAMEGFSVA